MVWDTAGPPCGKTSEALLGSAPCDGLGATYVSAAPARLQSLAPNNERPKLAPGPSGPVRVLAPVKSTSPNLLKSCEA